MSENSSRPIYILKILWYNKTSIKSKVLQKSKKRTVTNMISNEELDVLYTNTLSECQSLKEEFETLKASTHIHKNLLRKMFCNAALYEISQGYTKYSQNQFEKDELVQIYLDMVKILPKEYEYAYYHMTYHFFTKDYIRFTKDLEEYVKLDYETNKNNIKKGDDFLDEALFIDLFFEPFKQAFDGFWNTLANILRKYPSQKGIPELCEIIEQYYKFSTDYEALDFLLVEMQKHPHLVLIKELVAYTYYSMKMWNNAIAYFELVEENGIFFHKADLYFMLAWSYGKLKEHSTEEVYYKKALEIAPQNINIQNNLGYSLYSQKKYSQAIPCFEQCLNLNENYIYAADNYVRTLIALGRNRDAKDFVKSGKHKISKDIERRLEKLDNTNKSTQKSVVQLSLETSKDELAQTNAIDLGVKRQQFSNEKLLEDELTARIESGREVFGLKLKMYKRKGVYGRQFIIPIGRLDLLCEDANGDLYIIELKKDSGYDDAYKQTAAYLDWFESNDISKGKKVTGIICLNSPTSDLINRVHSDDRMRLFEYSISYTEL